MVVERLMDANGKRGGRERARAGVGGGVWKRRVDCGRLGLVWWKARHGGKARHGEWEAMKGTAPHGQLGDGGMVTVVGSWQRWRAARGAEGGGRGRDWGGAGGAVEK